MVHTVRDDRRRDAQELRKDVSASTITSPARGIALGAPGNGNRIVGREAGRRRAWPYALAGSGMVSSGINGKRLIGPAILGSEPSREPGRGKGTSPREGRNSLARAV